MDEMYEILCRYRINGNLPLLSDKPYILITHGGDTPASVDYKFLLRDPNLLHWYATNATMEDERITHIPIGVSYGKHDPILDEVMAMNIPKNKLLSTDCFAIHSWVEERTLCANAMRRNNLVMDERKSYRDYLISLKQSMFVLCPIGNGIDTFRFYEALYMGCVPIISERMNGENIKIKYPPAIHELWYAMCFSWESFKVEHLTEKLYESITQKKLEQLDFTYWNNLITK